MFDPVKLKYNQEKYFEYWCANKYTTSPTSIPDFSYPARLEVL